MKLCFGLGKLKVIGYSDADFFDDHDDWKSTSGHMSLFVGEAYHGQAKISRVYLDLQ